MKERRCDASCHEAREEKCTCICGGRNHGRRGALTYSLTEQANTAVLEGRQASLVFEEA